MSAGMGMEFSLRETSNFLTIGPSPPLSPVQTENISCPSPRDFNLPYSVNQQSYFNFYIIRHFFVSIDRFFILKY